ncbi:hypothetical protein [Natronorubrum aibiense]|uniref:Uncharacterized protein n=1 Tax=Natronorubrum aibiense TaxID=348826 RepID=A0A5P9P5C7_9EURY|nr:hypothetical protein [Natronorubrum aibiense]QFU83371.1 hypothetical protein GCU68_12895 [Natronorubrum aibiense]
MDNPSLEPSEEIDITLNPAEVPPTFEDLTLYPFSDQKIVRGTYEYESSPRFGSPEKAEGEFQIRSGSGLIILQTDSDRPRPEKILKALENSINSGFEIKSDFVPNQRKAWDFVEKSDKVLSLKLFTPSGSVKRANEIDSDWDELKNQSPIKNAYLEFENADGEPIQVEYLNDRLIIDSEVQSDRDYIIQIFESTVVSNS